MPHDVFVSYSSKDQSIADDVAAALEKAGIQCWIAPRDIEAGKTWAGAIWAAIPNSRVFVLIFSAASNASDEVAREVGRAMARKIRVIPFRIEEIEPTGDLGHYLSNVHWLDALPKQRDRATQELVDRIRAELQLPPVPEPAQPKQRRPILALACALLALAAAAFFLWRHRPSPNLKTVAPVDTTRRDSFLGSLPWRRWVIYDPTEYDPYHAKLPSDASIRNDLKLLRLNGITGLVTISSQGSLKDIPSIAHEEGFQSVIMGVWELRNAEEVANALGAAASADAYCIGHAGLAKRYSYGELEAALAQFRQRTGRVVAVSELRSDYTANPKLVELGDFLFPDVHSQWHDGAKPESVWSETLAAAQEMAALTARLPDRLILLNMVSYPSAGANGLTPESQAAFYHLALGAAKNGTGVPGRVAFSFLTAFDPVWKTAEYQWAPAEQHTGLFTADRKPKPALAEVQR